MKNFSEAAIFPNAESTSGSIRLSITWCATRAVWLPHRLWTGHQNKGKYKGIGEGPEYEATWAFGSDCYVDDLKPSTANFLCNELGQDSISMATTLPAL